MSLDKLTLSALSAGICIALFSGAAAAATPAVAAGTGQTRSTPAVQTTRPTNGAQPATQTSSPNGAAHTKLQTLEQIVVTGNVSAAGEKQLAASYAVNVFNSAQIHDFAPHSTADMLKAVPGLWVESSGGEAGANVYVSGFPGAGDAHFVNTELDGMPLYGAYGLSFMSSPDLFRIDDSVERMEVVQNGPNDIFGAGRPGATVNFIQKDGTQTPNGSGVIRATIGERGYHRVSGYWGGQVAPNWYFAGGGFYREGDGVHHTSFPINKGGQLEAILTHTFDNNNGKFSISARHTDDRDAFFTSAPMVSINGHLHALDQFDPRKDTLEGSDLHRVQLAVTPGDPPGTVGRDLAQGRGLKLTVIGSTFDWKFGNGWDISNKANFVHGTVPTNALFNGNVPPQTMASFLADSIASANADPAVVAAAGAPATAGTATFTDGGGAVNPDQLVLQTGFWTVQKHIRSFTDQVNLSKELFEGNTMTLGGYFAQYGTRDLWYLGNNVLTTLQNNARTIDVALNNGAVVSKDGFSGPSTDAFAEHWSGRNVAAFLADSWFIGRWQFNGGVRLEHQRDNGYADGNHNVDLDGNPLTLYNNNASVFSGETTHYRDSKTGTAWSFGANYGINANMAAYARVSKGHLFPMFDDIQGGNSGLQTVHQYEVGFKAQGRMYSVNVSAFYNRFRNLPFQAFVERDGELVNVTESGTSHAKGVELDATVRPVKHFSVNLTGDWLRGHYGNFGSGSEDFSGNFLQRQPKLQYRVTPEWSMPLSWGMVRVFATYSHIGSRFSDPSNAQVLPAYHTIDVGVDALVGANWEFRITGKNITNTLGLTEGNVRALGGVNGGGDIVYGRSIFGRTWMFSAAYHFGS